MSFVRNKRQWSELIAVQCRNIVTRNSKRNCLNSVKALLFDWFLFSNSKSLWFLFISWILLQLISLLQLIMRDFLRQRLMRTSTWLVVENSLLLLFITYCLWEHSLCEFDWKWSIDSIVVSFWSTFAKSTFFCETI